MPTAAATNKRRLDDVLQIMKSQARAMLVSVFALASMLAQESFGATQAVTSDGNVVILMDDKTWRYQDEPTEIEIKTNPKQYSRPSDAKFKVQAGETDFSVYMDPKKWTLKPRADEEDDKFYFESKSLDLYAMMVFEQAEIEISAFKEIALLNARKVAPDVTLTKAEFRMVNSLKVLYLEFGGTTSGIQVNYFGYYASNKSGSIQLLAYCGKNVKIKSEDIENILNGISSTSASK